MRIAIWWEQASWGGVDTHLYSLLSNWPNDSDSFCVYANDGNEGLMRIESSLNKLANISIKKFNRRLSFKVILAKLIAYLILPLRFPFYILHNFLILKASNGFDAIVIDQGGYPGAWGGLACLCAARLAGIKTRFLLVHHCAVGRGVFRQTFEGLMDLMVQSNATQIIAVSRATRRTLIERRNFYVEKYPIKVIHNGIDLSNVAQENLSYARGWLRSKLNISSGDFFLVGMIGRVERYKGHEDLIIGASFLTKSLRDKLRIVIIGSGAEDEINRLKILAENLGVLKNISFIGYFDENIKLILRELNLVAMLTKDFEGFGLTIAEAMSEGVPVIATNVGAVAEFFTNRSGYLIEPESHSDVCNAITSAMLMPLELKDKSLNAIAAIKEFNAKRMAINFHRIISYGA